MRQRIRPAGIGPLARSSPRHTGDRRGALAHGEGSCGFPRRITGVVAKVVAGHRGRGRRKSERRKSGRHPGATPGRCREDRPWSCRRVDCIGPPPRRSHGPPMAPRPVRERGSPSGSRPDTIFAFFSMRSKRCPSRSWLTPERMTVSKPGTGSAGMAYNRAPIPRCSLPPRIGNEVRPWPDPTARAGRSRLEGWRS